VGGRGGASCAFASRPWRLTAATQRAGVVASQGATGARTGRAMPAYVRLSRRMTVPVGRGPRPARESAMTKTERPNLENLRKRPRRLCVSTAIAITRWRRSSAPPSRGSRRCRITRSSSTIHTGRCAGARPRAKSATLTGSTRTRALAAPAPTRRATTAAEEPARLRIAFPQLFIADVRRAAEFYDKNARLLDSGTSPVSRCSTASSRATGRAELALGPVTADPPVLRRAGESAQCETSPSTA